MVNSHFGPRDIRLAAGVVAEARPHGVKSAARRSNFAQLQTGRCKKSRDGVTKRLSFSLVVSSRSRAKYRGGACRECRMNRGRTIIRECKRGECVPVPPPIDSQDGPKAIPQGGRWWRRIGLVSKSSYYICVINCPVCLTYDDWTSRCARNRALARLTYPVSASPWIKLRIEMSAFDTRHWFTVRTLDKVQQVIN